MIRSINVILLSLFLFANFAHAKESYNKTHCCPVNFHSKAI